MVTATGVSNVSDSETGKQCLQWFYFFTTETEKKLDENIEGNNLVRNVMTYENVRM